ncbi:MAG: hypothetical protein RML93_13790 [Anaerolineales bacterium]|nr:hypothetical protein [Anaerolineales bacterium]MDW8448346.1 hypothetical protein [Anaerolineales bacterium]
MHPKAGLGVYYFSDTQHYHTQARERWLREVSSLGVAWLILDNPGLIAIPEPFLQAALESGLTPIVRIVGIPAEPRLIAELEPVIRSYALWGVQYIQLFDRPNTQTFWGKVSWTSGNPVERFIDLFLPYAEILVKYNIYPIFPTPEVARGFWDTSFLRLALESLVRRGHQWLIETLILSAYLAIYDPSRPLNWGAGGPERWPNTQPYQESSHSQDQRGLYIADWYEALAQATLGRALPIVLLDDPCTPPRYLSQSEVHQRMLCAIRRLFDERSGEDIEIEGHIYEPFHPSVLCLGFYGLPCQPNRGDPRAWFLPNGQPLPIVEAIRRLQKKPEEPKSARKHTLPHALLLPRMAVSQLHQVLEKLKPFLLRYQPLIVFSLEEAAQAEHVWYVEGLSWPTSAEVEELEGCSCLLHPLRLDGTELAPNRSDSSSEALWTRPTSL